jgi:hypothetical protein
MWRKDRGGVMALICPFCLKSFFKGWELEKHILHHLEQYGENKMTKKTAWTWCAKYIKLRDAIEDYPISHDLGWVRCRTCGKWLVTKSKNAQAGHYKSRGTGGSSGIYWDERGLAIQCYQCNCFRQGAPKEFEEYLLKKYGQLVIDDLEFKHKTQSYKGKIPAIGLMYKQMYQELLEKLKDLTKGI